LKTADLDFELPPKLLATEPAEPRDAAKLLVHDRARGTTSHHHVRDLPDLGFLSSGDLMLVNRSKVIPACFKATRTSTGGKMQGLYLESPKPGLWSVLLESRGKLLPGEKVTLASDAHLTLIESTGPGQWLAELISPRQTLELLAGQPSEGLENEPQSSVSGGNLPGVGTTPLPPYIRKARKHLGQAEVNDKDAERYNTVFKADAARETGSVAAPTAGLHFTPQLLKVLKSQGIGFESITLHVGLGTFAPVKAESLDDHIMHHETFEVSEQVAQAIVDTRSRGGKIFCVGTTTVRAVESLPADILKNPRQIQSSTDLFITPGFEFRFVDHLMTNFHLPQSTLLALVASLPNLGLDKLKALYVEAIAAEYRFYSYGDTMLVV